MVQPRTITLLALIALAVIYAARFVADGRPYWGDIAALLLLVGLYELVETAKDRQITRLNAQIDQIAAELGAVNQELDRG